MRAKWGCGWAALFVALACLFVTVFAVSLFATGEAPIHRPRLTGFEPGPNYAFLPTTPITLSFDQPMEPTSVEAAFSLSPAVPGTFHWNEHRTETTFVPGGSGYEPGTKYTARVSAGARASTLPRTTQSAVEWWFSLPPLLEDVKPPAATVGVGAWPRLEAVFNYALDCQQTLSTFSISPGVAGALACFDQTVTFRPTEPLAPGTRYSATVNEVYLQNDPSTRPGVQWRLQTAPPLRIAAIRPSGMEPLTDLWVPVQISFNRPVVKDSVVARFSLALEGGPSLPGHVNLRVRARRTAAPGYRLPDQPT
jgi:hypothetical protein